MFAMGRDFFNNTNVILYFILALCLTLSSCENDTEQIAAITKPYNGPLEKISQ